MELTAAFSAPSAHPMDDAFFASVVERLEKARLEIEERFLGGGAALTAAYEIISDLLTAVDGIVSALDDHSANDAMHRLSGAVAHLDTRIATESRRQEDLAKILKASSAVPPQTKEMRGILSYLGTCATATKITGAGTQEFAGFANDVSSYVQNASTEVERFSSRITQINVQLKDMSAETARTLTMMRDTVPKVSGTLVHATDVIARRRHELGKVAARTSTLVRAIQAKVGSVLSALQIGDVTRQRIEHVQESIRQMMALSASQVDAAPLQAAALQLFSALLSSLNSEFVNQTRQIVDTIQSLTQDAGAILSLHRMTTHTEHHGDEDPMRVLEAGISAICDLVADADAAHRRAMDVQTRTGELAGELLDNASNIGNLRNVRDDIRCLAINAYLRCSRLGDKGRAVGVIATEMSTFGERLGAVAEAILDNISRIRALTGSVADVEITTDIAADLQDVARTLREVNASTLSHLDVIARNGGTVTTRIESIAHALDFSRSLGETLAECERDLRRGHLPAGAYHGTDSPLIQTFSEKIFPIYTMRSEREIHASIIPGDHNALHGFSDAAHHPAPQAEVDDFLL